MLNDQLCAREYSDVVWEGVGEGGKREGEIFALLGF